MRDGEAKRSVKKSGVTGTHTDYTCPATQAKRMYIRGDVAGVKRSVYKSGAMGSGWKNVHSGQLLRHGEKR